MYLISASKRYVINLKTKYPLANERTFQGVLFFVFRCSHIALLQTADVGFKLTTHLRARQVGRVFSLNGTETTHTPFCIFFLDYIFYLFQSNCMWLDSRISLSSSSTAYATSKRAVESAIVLLYMRTESLSVSFAVSK